MRKLSINKVLAIGLGLGIFVMAAWVGRLLWMRQSSTAIYLTVRGFDPRDLVAGHYLDFRVDFGGTKICEEFQKPAYQPMRETCLCFLDGFSPDSPAREFSPFACDGKAPPGCQVFVRGYCGERIFYSPFNRYYFPEEYKKQLVTVPDKAVIRVKLTEDGNGFIETMLVDGKPILDYAKEQKLKTPSPN
jgi:hypothetical protein